MIMFYQEDRDNYDIFKHIKIPYNKGYREYERGIMQ